MSALEVTLDLTRPISEQAQIVARGYFAESHVPYDAREIRLADRLSWVVSLLYDAAIDAESAPAWGDAEALQEFTNRTLTEIWRQLLTLLATFPITGRPEAPQ